MTTSGTTSSPPPQPLRASHRLDLGEHVAPTSDAGEPDHTVTDGGPDGLVAAFQRGRDGSAEGDRPVAVARPPVHPRRSAAAAPRPPTGPPPRRAPRRSSGSPGSPAELSAECERLLDERDELGGLLQELSEPFKQVRELLNQLPTALHEEQTRARRP